MSDILVKGKIIKEVYSNGSYKILAFSPYPDQMELVKVNKYGNVSLVGELGYLSVGEQYELKLKEESTNNYGTSYSVVSCPSLSEINVDELTREEAFKILTSFTTEKQANYILDAYPNFIAKVIKEGKESIDVSKIYNVGEAYLNAYVRELNEKYKYIHILNKYSDYQFNIGDCKNLYQYYFTNEKIETAVDETPYYALIEVLGRSFESADKLLCSFRHELVESNQRCEAMIMDILHENEAKGSSRIKGSELWKKAHDYDERLLKLIKDVCVNSANIYYNDDDKYIALMSTYLAEIRIKDWVMDKLSTDSKLDLNWSDYKVNLDGSELTDTQLNALKVFCESPISLLTGFSGVGKTFSVKALIRMLEDNNLTYTLVCPTGKASRVLSEQTGKEASTIHKRVFQGQINSDVIVVDEFGMVGLDVFCMLINSIINPNARIVFVGDPAQIPSISLGKIFDDFIASNIIPTTMLTEVFRYKSNGSLFVATNVRQGKSFFDDTEMVKYKDGVYSVCDNYKFIETDEDDIPDEVIKQYHKLLDKGIKTKDILILAPMNVGSMGTYAINNAIQAEVNPPKANEVVITRRLDKNTITFRVGDIVLNTKNDYHAVSYEAYQKIKNDTTGVLSEDDVADSMIVNGQSGIIREVLGKEGLVVQFDETLIYMNKAKVTSQLLLGYSISTFKAQGSTTDYTINIVSESHHKMLSRGLLYVADTRNKKSCIDIGSMATYERALNIVVNDKRDTFLLDLLLEDKNKPQDIEKDLTN